MVVETVLDVVGIGYDAQEMYQHPSFGNAGMLLWSIAAAAIPMVPGSYIGRAGGAAIKGSNTINKGSDSIKSVPKVSSKPPTPNPKPPVKKTPTPKERAPNLKVKPYSKKNGINSKLYGKGGRTKNGIALRKGILNAGPIRIGWSWVGSKTLGNYTFRIGLPFGKHIDLKLWK